jgi:hypothetical protein
MSQENDSVCDSNCETISQTNSIETPGIRTSVNQVQTDGFLKVSVIFVISIFKTSPQPGLPAPERAHTPPSGPPPG